VHKSDGPRHNERSASAAADSSAEIVEPSACEVCDADADPDIVSSASLTLILSLNEGVESAAACIVSTELGVAFGLLKATTPETISETLSSVYVAVDEALGLGVAVVVGDGVILAVEVAVGVAVAVVLGVAVAVGVDVADGVGVAVEVGVVTPLALSFTV